MENKQGKDINTMLGELVDTVEPLGQNLQATFAPLRHNREKIREKMRERSMLQTLGTERSFFPITAIDGAFTLTPLYLGDQINTLSLASHTSLDTQSAGILENYAESVFLPHHSANETCARAFMLGNELRLIGSTYDSQSLTLIDGSFFTGINALFDAIPHEVTAFENYLDDAMDEINDSIDKVIESPYIIACPKSDSATGLYQIITQDFGIPLSATVLTDKIIATFILDEGEYITLPPSSENPSLARFEMLASTMRSTTYSSWVGKIAEKFSALEPTLASYLKPFNSLTVIKAETKQIDDFERLDLIQSIADDCVPEFIQEPVSQYLADKFAKEVSLVSDLQIAESELSIDPNGENQDILGYMSRNYRTT